MARTPPQIRGEQTESEESFELMVEQDVRAAIEIAGDNLIQTHSFVFLNLST